MSNDFTIIGGSASTDLAKKTTIDESLKGKIGGVIRFHPHHVCVEIRAFHLTLHQE
ncbi:MAG TPA: hypothetical protein VJ771_05565 [Candidatus Nitrosotalea sp.]|nr:hypothetical protein [Candidatus Nitrosotalea sp.]